MKRHYSILFLSLVVFFSCNRTKNADITANTEFKPFIEIIDSAAYSIFESDASVEILGEGFEWSEGPLWVDGLGLLFSDIPPNKVFKWTEEKGVELYLSPSGYTDTVKRGGEPGSNGLLLDDRGQLILCQHGDRRIARMNKPLEAPAPDFETLVDKYRGKKLNSPNDACYHSIGDLYFTDPPYGLVHGVDDPARELDFQGVYRLSKGGELTLLTISMSRPNGIAFSRDESNIYIANSDPQFAVWMVYEVTADGALDNGKVFHDATILVEKEKGLPDGLKVSRTGSIFATGPGGVWVFDASGKVLAKIRTGQATSNCAFGPDEKELFITADMYLMRVKLKG